MDRRNQSGIPLKCYYSDCGYGWLYNGSMIHYATCPRCLRKLKINKATEVYHGCIEVKG